jgi:putative hemolysin
VNIEPSPKRLTPLDDETVESGTTPRSSSPSGWRELYPAGREFLPEWNLVDGRYSCRFARDTGELERVLRLRYEVFNLELGEGLDESHTTGLDRDPFDDHCHHMMVEDLETMTVVGTYRLQVAQMASVGHGFYTAQEYDMRPWPAEILEQAVETGRACIHRDHRKSKVLQILWKGLAAYALHNRRRYFFGCCSLSSQDPAEGARMLEYLRHHGYLHPKLHTQPHPAYACHEERESSVGWEQSRIPPLFRTYLRYGARICSRPALDRRFKTIDFLALIDLTEVDLVKVLRLTEIDLGSR